MNNFGTNNLGQGKEIIVQDMIFNFIYGALSLVFVGAFLTGFVGAVIWLTSGGHEGRNDSSVTMMKASLIGMGGSFLAYVAVKFFASFI